MADNKLADQFKGLPLRELISAPINAAAESQMLLAETAFKYMEKIGFDKDKKAKILSFELERPVETPSGIQKSSITVNAPLLGLVPIPSLLIEDISVDFQMEITATSQNTEKDDQSASASLKAGSWWGGVSVEGKVSSSRENTRSTNQSAKYNIRVNARQQQPTEGLSRLMDILASCTAPLSTK